MPGTVRDPAFFVLKIIKLKTLIRYIHIPKP